MNSIYTIAEETIKAQVLADMSRLGIAPHNPNEIIADGELHRYTIEGDNINTKNGAYRIHTDGRPAWYLKDWKRGIDTTGKFNDGVLSGSDLEAYRTRLNDEGYMQHVELVRYERERKEQERKKKATAQAQELFKNAAPVSPEHEYIRRKGMKNIANFRLGDKGELLIPITNAETKAFMSVQRIQPDGQKFFIKDTATGGGCYSFAPKKPDERLHFICEGIATGDTVYNLTGGKYRVTCTFTCHHLLDVTKAMMKRYPRSVFVIASDNDTKTEADTGNNPGRSAAKFVVTCGYAKGIVIPSFKPNEDGTDWNDYALLHGEEKAAKEFMHQLDIVLSTHEPEVSEVDILTEEDNTNDIKDKEDKAQLVFERLCGIRDRYLKGRNIFFHGSIKGGEYWQYAFDGGYWYRMTDADLQAELANFVEHKETNHHIKELSMMVRLFVTRSIRPDFNNKPVVCFRNGTLELDTGTFREHRPEDFTTWALGYDYNPNTKCERFSHFLEEVSNGDITRINFLHDMLGYILYPDNRLERAFFLIGGGKNGKSVLLHVIEDVFRNVNRRDNAETITHVAPCTLDNPTQIIKLEGALVNLTADINPNLKGCEAYIKSLISGDTLSGNYKFCDNRSFTSRAKIIASCNSMIRLNDDTYGMRRKLMFCKFERCFDVPDIHLKEKLFDERAGIFNLIYAAYRELLAREEQDKDKAIRASKDQSEFMTEFANTANPVRSFWEEYGEEYCGQHEVKKSAAFDDYRRFCERNGLYAGTERAFHKAFFNLLQELLIDVDNTLRRRDKDKPDRFIYYYVFNSKRPPEHVTPNAENEGTNSMVQAVKDEQAKQETTEQQTHNDEGTTDSEDTTQGTTTRGQVNEELQRILEAGRIEPKSA